MLAEPRHDLPRAVRRREAGKLPRVRELRLLRLHHVRKLRLAAVRRDDHRRHRQLVRARELEVAAVVRGHAADCAGAVLHQHVVGDPDREALAVGGIGHVATGEDAVLLFLLAFDERPRSGAPHVVENVGLLRRSFHQRRDQRMLGREHEESRTEERVRPSGEDRKVEVQLVHTEEDLGALRATDPVPLHRQHPLGP